MGYDCDVIVVGGGPAGISAAIRTRWVKRYKSIPCSTLIIESACLGGLAGWHGCLFTGPSWSLSNEDIVNHLTEDIQTLQIPVHQGRVTRITTKGLIKEVMTADGELFRCLVVIIATGIKALVNEREYLGRGLEVTSMGYEFIVSSLTELLSKRWEPRLVIVGSPKLTNLIPIINELNAARSPIVFIMEEDGETEGDIIRGWVEAYWGEDCLEGVRVQTSQGIQDIPCRCVLLDFNSYEISPTGRIDLEGFEAPFVQVDQDMQTSVPGIMAAGDVTAGGYNSFSRAISQGISAGLSAYCYVYHRKFGISPYLFAYRPTDFVLSPEHKELPSFDEGLMPRALLRDEDIQGMLHDGEKGDWGWLVNHLHGFSSIREIADERGVPVNDLMTILRGLIERKAITLHIGIDS